MNAFSSSTPIRILIAESFSCQRDMILNLKSSWLAPKLTIFACHSVNRVDILSAADRILSLMPTGEAAVAWVLAQCLQHHIQLVFVGKHGKRFEAQREAFERYNIVLITGAMGIHQHELIDDKYQFTQCCLEYKLPAISAYPFENATQLQDCLTHAMQQHPQQTLCAKPVQGVFAYGFVCLKDDANLKSLFNTPMEITTDNFCQQYARVNPPLRYILMPYLTGSECSVDIACHQGSIIGMATRIKETFRQNILIQGPCDDICHPLVRLFQLDGLINIQFKQDQYGIWHILEINARPAGGFAYCMHSGVNLMADLIAQKLSLFPTDMVTPPQSRFVYPLTTSISDVV